MRHCEVSLRNFRGSIDLVGMDPQTRAPRHEIAITKGTEEPIRLSERELGDLTRLLQSVAYAPEAMANLLGVRRSLAAWGKERGIEVDPVRLRAGGFSLKMEGLFLSEGPERLTYQLGLHGKRVMTVTHDEARDLGDLGYEVSQLVKHMQEGGTLDTLLEREGYQLDEAKPGRENWTKREEGEQAAPAKTPEQTRSPRSKRELVNGVDHSQDIAR